MHLHRNIAISESGFIFNPSRGDSFSANPIAVEIIEMMRHDKTLASIKEQILYSYEVDEVTFEKDFYDLVNSLKQYNLLEE